MQASMIQADMKVALGLAQYIAPIDTGNLRYNAIIAERTPDGFCIRYSLPRAFYIYFLEEGTRKFQGHKGFIGGQTVPVIAGYLFAKYSLKDETALKQFKSYARKGNNQISEMLQESDIRQRHSLSLDIKELAVKNNWQSSNIDYQTKFTRDVSNHIDYGKR